MLMYEYLSFLSKGDFQGYHGYTLHLTNISHSQYLNILTWLQDIQDTIAIFLISFFFVTQFPKEFGCKENNTKNKVCPESLTYVQD